MVYYVLKSESDQSHDVNLKYKMFVFEKKVFCNKNFLVSVLS